MKKLTVLTISHIIYLTEEERYNLFLLQDVETIGVSIPIWFNATHHSEPAKEVFCKYLIMNRLDDSVAIKIRDDGYEITLPHKKPDLPKISDKEWRSMSPKQMNNWYDSWPTQMTCMNLLNIEDGGSAGMHYREHNRIQHGNDILNIAHYVQIDDISKLENSLVKFKEGSPSWTVAF